MPYKYEFPEQLAGERIILKKWDVSFDMAKTIYQLVDESRDNLRVFLPWPDLMKRAEDEFDYISGADKKWKNKELADYAIISNQTGELLGGIGIMHFYENGAAEIGYWLGTKYQGNGYMREAVRLIEDAYFPNLHRLIIKNDVKNVRSAHIPERLGYHKDGIMREALIYADGHYGDLNVWSKLHSEWEKEQD